MVSTGVALALATVLGLLGGPGAAHAQEPPLEYRFAVLGGANGIFGDGAHFFAGFEGGAMSERFGGVGLLQLGTGNGFVSHFVAAGPAWGPFRGESVDLVGFVGPSIYREIEPSGNRRWLWTATLGLSARIRIAEMPIAVSLTGSRGSYDRPDFVTELSVARVRLGVGIGWGWRAF